MSDDYKPIGEFFRMIGISPETHTLALHNRVGEIELSAGEDGMVEVKGRVEVAPDLADQVGEADWRRDAQAYVENGVQFLRNAHLDAPDARKWRIHWEIRMPSRLLAEVHNGIGGIRLHGIEGGLRIKSGVGSVLVECPTLPGSGEVRFGTGKVVIEANRIEGKLEIRGGVGEVCVSTPSLTGEGIDIRTGTGKVEVGIPADFGGSLDLKSGVGRIQLEGMGEHRLAARGFLGARLEAKLGDAPVVVRARTGVGQIALVAGAGKAKGGAEGGPVPPTEPAAENRPGPQQVPPGTPPQFWPFPTGRFVDDDETKKRR